MSSGSWIAAEAVAVVAEAPFSNEGYSSSPDGFVAVGMAFGEGQSGDASASVEKSTGGAAVGLDAEHMATDEHGSSANTADNTSADSIAVDAGYTCSCHAGRAQ